MRRLRKTGATGPNGEVVRFPFLPRVTGACHPPGWRHWPPAEKVEHLLGLDRCRKILSWPASELDPLNLSMQVQVLRIVLTIGARLKHPRAGLANAEWRALSPVERLERLFDMSLDRAHEILSWRPIIELDPLRISLRAQVWHVIFMVGTKALLDGKLGREATRERDRECALDEAVRRFDSARQPEGTAPNP